MINNTNNNLSFQGRFLFEGNKSERRDFIRFLRNELKEIIHPYNIDIESFKLNGKNYVFTEYDCIGKPKKTKNSGINSLKSFLNADSFYDKRTKRVLPSIVEFDPVEGLYCKLLKIDKKNYTAYKKYVESNDGFIDVFDTERVDFKRNFKITEAFDFLRSSLTDLLYKTNFKHHNFADYKKAIAENKFLSNIKTKGISGAGRHSMLFNINDRFTLKLSSVPCYPAETKKFDLPILDKGHIVANDNFVYYCITPKGQNHNEIRVPTREIKNVINKIENEGMFTQDITDDSSHQIVIHEGKHHLCDYDCACLPTIQSRLFKADNDLRPLLW